MGGLTGLKLEEGYDETVGRRVTDGLQIRDDFGAVLIGFMEYFFSHQLFGKREDYAREIGKASLEKLADLIKVCVFFADKSLPFLEQRKNGN